MRQRWDWYGTHTTHLFRCKSLAPTSNWVCTPGSAQATVQSGSLFLWKDAKSMTLHILKLIHPCSKYLLSCPVCQTLSWALPIQQSTKLACHLPSHCAHISGHSRPPHSSSLTGWNAAEGEIVHVSPSRLQTHLFSYVSWRTFFQPQPIADILAHWQLPDF